MSHKVRHKIAFCLCCAILWMASTALAESYTLRVVGDQLYCYRGGEVVGKLPVDGEWQLSIRREGDTDTILEVTDGEGGSHTLTLQAAKLSLQGRFRELMLDEGINIPISLGESTQIGRLSLKNSSHVTISGGTKIEQISVQGRTSLTLESGAAAAMVVLGDDRANITVQRGASVDSLYTDGYAKVQGDGDVKAKAALKDQPTPAPTEPMTPTPLGPSLEPTLTAAPTSSAAESAGPSPTPTSRPTLAPDDGETDAAAQAPVQTNALPNDGESQETAQVPSEDGGD